MDGSGSYKGKAEGSNSSEGLWIASPAKTPLAEAKRIYWFESAYDAMAYYQLNLNGTRNLERECSSLLAEHRASNSSKP